MRRSSREIWNVDLRNEFGPQFDSNRSAWNFNSYERSTLDYTRKFNEGVYEKPTGLMNIQRRESAKTRVWNVQIVDKPIRQLVPLSPLSPP